jgi:hypothetical protein
LASSVLAFLERISSSSKARAAEIAVAQIRTGKRVEDMGKARSVGVRDFTKQKTEQLLKT